MTNSILYPLIRLDSPLTKSYWQTHHCANVLLQDGQTLKGKYCNNRWCVVCNRIRTAEMIFSYGEEVRSIPDKHFLTLSRRNVPADELNNEIDAYLKDFRKLMDNLNRRRKGNRIKGIRKLEVTYNPNTDTYHPHLHCIFSKADADLIHSKWMEINKDRSHYKGQDNRPADDNSVIELFKYCTKLFKINRREKDADGRQIIRVDVKPLDVIFQALRNRRTFESYNLTKQVQEDISEVQLQEYPDLFPAIEIWQWDNTIGNYTTASGEILTPDDFSTIYSVKV